MRARRADVPLERDASGRFLPWLVGFMVYLAALALTGALAMHKLVERWDQGLAGRLTVQVPAPERQAGHGEQAQRIDRVLEVLTATPGVRSAEVLAPDEIAELLEPWLGEGTADQDLPLPVLIAVTIDQASAPDVRALGRRLEEAVPGVMLDDHQRWLGSLLDLAHTIELVAGLVILSVGLSAIVTVVFVTRTGLAIHHQVIELLHLIGAQDNYVAGQFQGHALRLGLRGGICGLLVAVATIALVRTLLGRVESGILPDLSLTAGEWLLLALLPLAAALVAMLTARLTVLRTLSRLP